MKMLKSLGRLLGICIVILLFCCVPKGMAQEGDTGITATTSGTVNVRANYSTSARIVGTLEPNTTVAVYASARNEFGEKWYQIGFGSARSWIASWTVTLNHPYDEFLESTANDPCDTTFPTTCLSVSSQSFTGENRVILGPSVTGEMVAHAYPETEAPGDDVTEARLQQLSEMFTRARIAGCMIMPETITASDLVDKPNNIVYGMLIDYKNELMAIPTNEQLWGLAEDLSQQNCVRLVPDHSDGIWNTRMGEDRVQWVPFDYAQDDIELRLERGGTYSNFSEGYSDTARWDIRVRQRDGRRVLIVTFRIYEDSSWWDDDYVGIHTTYLSWILHPWHAFTGQLGVTTGGPDYIAGWQWISLGPDHVGEDVQVTRWMYPIDLVLQ